MIVSFRNSATEDIFDGKASKSARKVLPQNLWRVASKKLDQLDSVTDLNDLRVPPGNRLEVLSGNRKGQHSIRINDQYRICLSWTDSGPDLVVITDYH
jgi:proteic killer suppression protein